MISQFKKWIFQDFNAIERAGFPIALGIVLYGFFLAMINLPYYDAVYTVRNGFVCSLQQLFLLLMMLLSAYRTSFYGLAQRRYLYSLCWLFFTLLFLFGFGEKIRWGQFIFDLQVPSFFQQYNTQGQITLHNLRFGEFSVNKVIFGSFLALVVVLYTLVLPFVYQRFAWVSRLVERFGIPVPRKSQVAWYAFIVAIALLNPVPKKGEVVQFAGVWSFLMFFCYPANYNQVVLGHKNHGDQ